MTNATILLVMFASGCSERTNKQADTSDNSFTPGDSASDEQEPLPREGLWRLTSFTENQNTCSGINFAPLETAELGQVTDLSLIHI